MFNKTHALRGTTGPALAFVRSKYVQAYPCGRRRSTEIDPDNDSDTKNSYYIPFDPEARLNTEANNRRYSSLNGFKQTYLNDWGEAGATLVLDGYLFTVELPTLRGVNYSSIESFVGAVCALIGADVSSTDEIYANIRIAEVPLFSSNALKYSTYVLRNQSATEFPSECLDLPQEGAVDLSSDSFYFSGLSFSTQSVARYENTNQEQDRGYTFTEGVTYDTVDIVNESRVDTHESQYSRQRVISLCILRKDQKAGWQINRQALLPEISHGATENSVQVDELFVNSLRQDGRSVPSLKLADMGDGTYQMQFFNVDLT
jgi:hypothetical protein